MAALRHQQPVAGSLRTDRLYNDADPDEQEEVCACAAIPGVFMALITFWAGYEQVVNIYVPKQQYLLASLAVIAMVLMLIVFVNTFRRWYHLWKINAEKVDIYGETVKELVER